jgi:uncharacterized protein
MNYSQEISQQLHISLEQVEATMTLLDEENTIPFIARYRKESTGGLDEKQLRDIKELLSHLRALADRRKTILSTIREQGKLTPDLETRIQQARSMTELEDFYRPYKPRRTTRASLARERGLEPLAHMIRDQKPVEQTLSETASPFLNEQVPTPEEAWEGAQDIVAEMISDDPVCRQAVRNLALSSSRLQSEKKANAKDPRHVFQNYYAFKTRVDRLQPHQILALNRGEDENVLTIKLTIPRKKWRAILSRRFPANSTAKLADHLQRAREDGAERLLLPSIKRDVRRTLTEKAENHAIQVFARNLRALLVQPPLTNRVIMGLDPAYRTGCKVAVIDPTGKPLDTSTIYPVAPQNKTAEAEQTLKALIKEHQVRLIALGNGTASRETELFLADFLKKLTRDVRYLIVNEAGASVYSASELARKELPDMDVSLRGAVSIARRAADPLAELVKIDPKSIGVGMYQHDVDQSNLNQKLDDVVESVVNQVGVDLNTASAALLAHVSGIGPALAKKIVAYRDQHGPFSSRAHLTEVQGLGPKTFQQAAGFLRIRGGSQPLDATAIHPESYPIAEQILSRAGIKVDDPIETKKAALVELSRTKSAEAFAADLGTGQPTLFDIFKQLVQPGRDPRADLPEPVLRQDVLTMEDLETELVLPGTVRNVVDFGAFIDIGVKHDGLLHQSNIPRGVDLRPGDVIQVTILKIDRERSRISLGWA